MNHTLLELQNIMVLRHTEPTGLFGLWGAKPVRALDGVSLTLRRGETLGVMGGSGAGKSTLAEAATLRRPIERGRILLEGQEASRLSGDEKRKAQRRLQLVRQDARESLEMDQTVQKQLRHELRQAGLPDPDARLTRALEQVELNPPEFLERTPGQMSGGQQQRLAIARALAMNPLMVGLDEPVSGVDPQLRQGLLGLFQRVQKQQNLAYMVISQDPQVISKLSHQVAVMHSGRLYEVGPAERILGEARHPYSRLFLGLEDGDLPPEEDTAGQVFAGCPWVANCPAASEQCRREVPQLREVAPGQLAACHAL